MDRKEAIRRIKAWNLDPDDMDVLSVAIPELAESEDERIRKYILRACEETIECGGKGLELSMDTTKKLAAYLEKQKEQKEIPLMNGDADLYFDNWNQQKQNPTKVNASRKESGMLRGYRKSRSLWRNWKTSIIVVMSKV